MVTRLIIINLKIEQFYSNEFIGLIPTVLPAVEQIKVPSKSETDKNFNFLNTYRVHIPTYAFKKRLF